MDVENISLWKERIQNCLDSNLPVKTWCKQNNISPPTFYYWRKRLEHEKDSIPETTPVFAKVTSVASSNVTVQQTALQTMPRIFTLRVDLLISENKGVWLSQQIHATIAIRLVLNRLQIYFK